MTGYAGALVVATALVLCSSAPAAAADPVRIDWNRTPPDSGRVVGDAAVVTAEDMGGSFPLITIEDPSVSVPGYEISGRISYEDVEGLGYIEMWSVFEDGSRYFSRTLAQVGPMAALTGTSGWREFVLPFDLNDSPPPTRLEIGVVLPGRGKVRVGPLRLLQLGRGVGGGGWWSARAAGIAGGVGGTMLGLLGAVIGSLASRGRARRFVLAIILAAIVIGCVLVVTGGVALLLSQPYAVYFPLLLAGCIMVGVFGVGIRTVRRTYAQAELRRMRAFDAA